MYEIGDKSFQRHPPSHMLTSDFVKGVTFDDHPGSVRSQLIDAHPWVSNY